MRNKALVGICVALAVAVAVLLAVVLRPAPTPGPGTDGGSTGVSGIITDDWDTGIDHGSVETSDITVPGYTHAVMSEGDTTLHLNIGNPETNGAGFVVSVELADGTVLYKSPLLLPGQGVSELPLLTSPEKGTYDAYAIYQIVSLDDAHTPMNSSRSAFTLYVQ